MEKIETAQEPETSLDVNMLQTLRRTSLFRGISSKEVSAMAHCLGAVTRTYEPGQVIFRCGDAIQALGIVHTGTVHIVRMGYWGDENLVDVVGPGDVFAENYACMSDTTLNVNVVAARKTEVVFLHVHKVLHTCSSMCPFHIRLVDNLVGEIAHKNYALSNKMASVTQRTTRKKVLAYLSQVAMKKGMSSFEIPMNRQELADFLAVDRSALSSELSKLQKDGVISFSRNHFELLQDFPDANIS